MIVVMIIENLINKETKMDKKSNNQQQGQPTGQRPKEEVKLSPVPLKQESSETMHVFCQGKDGDFVFTIQILNKDDSPKTGVVVRIIDLGSSLFKDLTPTDSHGTIQCRITFHSKERMFRIIALGTAIAPRTKTLFNHKPTMEKSVHKPLVRNRLAARRLSRYTRKTYITETITITYRKGEENVQIS